MVSIVLHLANCEGPRNTEGTGQSHAERHFAPLPRMCSNSPECDLGKGRFGETWGPSLGMFIYEQIPNNPFKVWKINLHWNDSKMF